jgi:hypothetical protein
MATMGYARKRLQKWAGRVVEKGDRARLLMAQRGNQIIEVQSNGWADEVGEITYREANERDDFSLDYCAGTFCDTVQAAIAMAERMTA